MKGAPIANLATVILMLAAVLCGCRFYRETGQTNTDPAPPASQNQSNESLTLFGNISEAAEDPNNFLITGGGSTFSYNISRGTVNWIAWRTQKSDLGDSAERPDFRPDMRLPSGFKRVVSSDYSGSGYDRGHMVPAADRFGTPATFGETFLMTNIVPQTSALNQYPWQQFESYVRGEVRRGWTAYQIAGVYGEIEILKGRVVVPANCWKVVVLLQAGAQVSMTNNRKRVIAVDIPNIDGIENQKWQRYRTNIRSIEQKTGYNFFAALPADLQETIETRTEQSFR